MVKNIIKSKLRYGENPNQDAYLLHDSKNSIFNYQISGKEISYNNILDVDSGLRCLDEFNEPTSVIIKHTNPCGVASAKNINKAFQKSFESDPKSAFGGIILLNRKVNEELAKILIKNFFEMIVSPGFDKAARNILTLKKRLILLKKPKFKKFIIEYKSTIFGDLYQSKDLKPINQKFLKLVSKNKASLKSKEDLLFAIKVVKHLKSNSIVLARNKQTIGIGNGQTNRVDSLKFAIKNRDTYFKKKFICLCFRWVFSFY